MICGNINKMKTVLGDPVDYTLPLGDDSVAINPLIGRKVALTFDGTINCTACGRKTGKSFNQGYCYPCSQRLAECDICIVRPEKCHYDQGTCRDPEWAQDHCMQPHYVYLANSSGIKVGITRGTQIPTRWIDQGAGQALPIFKVQNRFQSGLLEVALKAHVADRTDWRRMLKGEAETVDLEAARDDLVNRCGAEIDAIMTRFGDAIQFLNNEQVITVSYPVAEYPQKITALNLDKNPQVEGVLQGIKGQYLIFDSGVLNVRKYTGYNISIGVSEVGQ